MRRSGVNSDEQNRRPDLPAHRRRSRGGEPSATSSARIYRTCRNSNVMLHAVVASRSLGHSWMIWVTIFDDCFNAKLVGIWIPQSELGREVLPRVFSEIEKMLDCRRAPGCPVNVLPEAIVADCHQFLLHQLVFEHDRHSRRTSACRGKWGFLPAPIALAEHMNVIEPHRRSRRRPPSAAPRPVIPGRGRAGAGS